MRTRLYSWGWAFLALSAGSSLLTDLAHPASPAQVFTAVVLCMVVVALALAVDVTVPKGKRWRFSFILLVLLLLILFSGGGRDVNAIVPAL